MGCDIHGCIEKKIGDKWVMVDLLVYDDRASSRNYQVYAELASVRGESNNKPKGIPEDVSEGTQYHIDYWGTDGHSHSWHSLEDTLEIYKDKNDISDDVTIEETLYEFFNHTNGLEKCLDECRFVFWFVFWFDN